jgi:hypothetical protein
MKMGFVSKVLSISSLQDMNRIIAAERRDVYSHESPLMISAKSEMLGISLFAEEVRGPCTFYKHSVPTARYCPDSLASDYF